MKERLGELGRLQDAFNIVVQPLRPLGQGILVAPHVQQDDANVSRL
jgi:hypothetical protein